MNILNNLHGSRNTISRPQGGRRLQVYQLVLLALFLFLVPCVAILRSTDYVTADPAHKTSEETVYILAEQPVTIPMEPQSENWRSILLHLASPARVDEQAGEGMDDGTILEITLTDAEGTVLARSVLDEAGSGAGLSLDGEVTEITLDQVADAVLPEMDMMDGQAADDAGYTLALRSNADTEDAAYQMALCEDGTFWYRCTYRWMSNSMRLLTETLAAWLAIVVLAGVLLPSRADAGAAVRPERLFLAASIVLGILYFLVLPCMLVPDSSNHFVRSYLLTRGMLVLPAGGQVTIPSNLLPYASYTYTPYILLHSLSEPIDWSNTITYDAVNMALYSPLNYIVQAVGILAASLVTQNANAMQVIGAAFNYVVCTGILYWSIKKVPYGKTVIMILALVPMAVQERASLSADSITYACVIAMLAFCLHMQERQEPMKRREYVQMFLLLIMAASCKVIYFVIGFMILLIPAERFGREGQSTRMRAMVTKAAGCVVLLVFSVGWIGFASGYLGSTRAGGDTAAKVDIILHQTVRYIYILNKTVMNDGISYLYEMIGYKMGPTNILISPLIIFMAIVVIMIAIVVDVNVTHPAIATDADHENTRWAWLRHRYFRCLYMLAIATGICLLVMTSLYIQWTSLEAATYSIEGLQGRYFMPAAPCAVLAIICALRKPSGATPENAAATNPTAQTEQSAAYRSLAFAIAAINVLVLIYCWSHSSYIG